MNSSLYFFLRLRLRPNAFPHVKTSLTLPNHLSLTYSSIDRRLHHPFNETHPAWSCPWYFLQIAGRRARAQGSIRARDLSAGFHTEFGERAIGCGQRDEGLVEESWGKSPFKYSLLVVCCGLFLEWLNGSYVGLNSIYMAY